MVYVIKVKSIAEARYEACKLIMNEGEDHWDERGELTKEIKNLCIWLTGKNRYPAGSSTQIVLGEDFRKGLIDDKTAVERGTTFDYGYGLELREDDALRKTIQLLKEHPETRRACIPILKPRHVASKDEIPCFVTLDFLLRDEILDETMFARSNENFYAMINDIYGFTGLQEWVAKLLGVEVGDYTQFACSAHLRIGSDEDGINQLLLRGC